MEEGAHFLSDEEFEKLKEDPVALRETAEKALRKIVEANNEATLVQQLDYERRFNQLEQRIVSCTKENEVLLTANRHLKSELEAFETRDKATRKQLNQSEAEGAEKEAAFREINGKMNELTEEKREALRLLSERNVKLVSISEEAQKLREANLVLEEARSKTEQQLREKDSSVLLLESAKARVEREKEYLQNQNKWLDSELRAKSEELLELRKETVGSRLDLQARVEELEIECARLTGTVAELQKRNGDLHDTLDKKLGELKVSREERLEEQDHFRQEIETKDKLVRLFEEASIEASTKVKELQGALEEVHSLVASTKATYEQSLAKVRQAKRRASEKWKASQKEVEELKERLTSSIPLSSMPEEVKTLGTFGGSPSLSLVRKYEEVTKALLMQKNENRRLNNYLNQILREMEQKAPVLREQRQEYEKMCRRHTQLTSQLEAALIESEGMRAEMASLKKENSALELETKDLSRQVTLLLKEINDSSGLSSQAQAPSLELLTADQVISHRLVTFKDIQELQLNNQKLLRLVRQLSSEKESQAQEVADSRLAEAYKEMEKLRRARQATAEKVQAIMRQRDMYKSLLAQMPASALAVDAKGDASVDAVSALKESQREFDIYREERQKDIRSLQQELDGARREAGKQQMDNAKLSARIEFLEDRLKLYSAETKQHLGELNSLRDQNAKLSSSVLVYEKQLHRLREELDISTREAKQQLVLISNLSAEKEASTKAEVRMTEHVASLRADLSREQALTSNLQALLLSRDTALSENKQQGSEHARALKEELDTLKLKLAKQEAEYKENLLSLQLREAEIRQKLEKREEEFHTMRETIIKLENQNQLLAKHHASLEILFAKQADSSSTEGQQPQPARQLQQELISSRLISLNEELEQERENLSHYKAVAAEREQSAIETQEAFDRYKASMETLLKEARLETKGKQERVELLEKLLEEAAQKTSEQQQDVEKQLQTAQETQTRLEEELRSTQAKLALAEEKMAAHAEDLQRVTAQAEEARCNYNRELILHSADVEALARLKDSVQALSREKQLAVDDRDAAQQALRLQEASYKSAVQKLERQIVETDERYSELKKQNDILHTQLQELANRAVQQTLPAETEQGELTAVQQAPKSMEQLTEVVAYLRREVNIHATRQEAAQQEAWRYKQQAEQALRSLDECRAKLAAAQEAAHDKEHSQAQHRILLEQLGQLNLLRESNVTLREEAERYKREATEAEQKLEKVKEQIDPLLKDKLELAAQLEVVTGQKEAALADVARWRGRVDQLLDRYERIDPEAHRLLRQEHDDLVQSHAALQADMNARQADLDAALSKLRASEEKAAKLLEHGQHWKSQTTKLSGQLKSLQQELEEERKRRDEKDKEKYQELEKELDALRKKVGAMQQEKESAEKEAENLRKRAETTNQPEKDKELEDLKQKTKRMQGLLKLTQKALAQKTSEIARLTATPAAPTGGATPMAGPTPLTPPTTTTTTASPLLSPTPQAPPPPTPVPQVEELPFTEQQPPVKRPRIAPAEGAPEEEEAEATSETAGAPGLQQPPEGEVIPQLPEQPNETEKEMDLAEATKDRASFEAARMRPLSAVPRKQQAVNQSASPAARQSAKRKADPAGINQPKGLKRAMASRPPLEATTPTPETMSMDTTPDKQPSTEGEL